MSRKKNSFLKVARQYIIQIIIFVLVANSGIAFLIFSKAQNANCIYQDQINADQRCLYVYHNEVYEKGTKRIPHKGIECGTNVDDIIPILHFSGNIVSNFNAAKIGAYCGATAPTVAPTQAPTVAPTQQPTDAPTVAPTQQAATEVPTLTSTQKPTQKPTQQPATQQPATQQPTNTASPTEQSTTYSGNTFGEILGKPKAESIQTIIPTIQSSSKTSTAENKKFKLTVISKPLTYASVVSFVGSILLLFIF